jgi:hypothetical protein
VVDVLHRQNIYLTNHLPNQPNMKKFLILIAVLLFTYSISNAQTEKGTQTLGVNLGFTSNTSNNLSISTFDNSTTTLNSKTTNFNIGPNYSYFIADKIDIAVTLSYNSSVLNNKDNTNSYPLKQSNYNYGGSINIRKYFMYANKFGIRTGPYIGYANGGQKILYTGTNAPSDLNSKSNYYNAGINLDMVYYPTPKLGIAATLANLAYTHFKTDNANQGHASGNDVNFNFINNGLLLSVFYVFGSK